MATKVLSRFERDMHYREAFVARLNAHSATPTADWPTVRYWANPAFQSLCRRVRAELAGQGLESDLSNKALLEWLAGLGLAREIAADGQSFHLIEIGAAAVVPDPLELLMAERPHGVICYFSAVAFHSLTTQPARHHHIAEVRAAAPKAEADDEAEEPVTPDRPPPIRRTSAVPRLGRLLFRFGDQPYYATRRNARLVPGVQTRAYGFRTQLRITDYEQTLLDMLYKPFHCGGPEVVLEASQRTLHGLDRPDEDVLADYLKRMDYPAITRRLGAMFDLIGSPFPPEDKLQRVLDEARANIDRESPFARISLLPGVPYTNLNADWLVYTP